MACNHIDLNIYITYNNIGNYTYHTIVVIAYKRMIHNEQIFTSWQCIGDNTVGVN